MLIINEQLENDILTIDEGIDHLDKHEVFMDYDALLGTIKEKNQQVRERINEIDSKFAEMYDDLNTMYANRKKKQEKEEEKKKDEENIEKPIEDKDNEDSIIENNYFSYLYHYNIVCITMYHEYQMRKQIFVNSFLIF